MTTLTLEKPFFVLYTGGESLPLARVKKARDVWAARDSETFETTSLKAAREFRRYADAKAEKFFKKVFVQFFEAPDLSRLKFLDPHQVDGVRWVLSRSRSYLAHAPGAGKTAQAIVSATLADPTGPALFIVPPGLTANWERELRKFLDLMPPPHCDEASSTVIGRTEDAFLVDWNARFFIVPDSMLAKPWVLDGLLKIKPKFIAVDEASRFKESASQRTRALFSSGLILNAKHVVLMDGSPMPNRAVELWAPTYAMNPEAIDCLELQDFGMKYGAPQLNDYYQYEFKGTSNHDELRAKLTKDFMHIVPESALNHPERRRSIVFTDHTRGDWGRDFKIKLSDISEDAATGELAKLRSVLGHQKTGWTVDYVRQKLRDKNESILLFGWHREVCEALAEGLRGFDARLVIGGTRDDERERAFSDFQTGECKIIVGNIAAMGRGHNLQRADRVIFAEYSWTDELNKQCEKRASRRGREQSAFVRCEYIVIPNSLDEIVLNAVFRKARDVKRVVE